MEQRWSARRAWPAEVAIDATAGRLTAILRDISLGGMYLVTGGVRLPVGAPVVVGFALRAGAEASFHRLRAVVVRSSAEGAGLMYADPQAEALHPLRETLYPRPASPAREHPGQRPAAAAGVARQA